MRVIHWVALILVIIGALNMGMWGFFHIEVIGSIFKGRDTAISRIIYAFIGLSGLWCFSLFKILASCDIKQGK